MGILDEVKRNDQQQEMTAALERVSAQLTASTEQQAAIGRQLTELTTAVNDLNGAQKSIGQRLTMMEQARRAQSLSDTSASEPVQKRLAEIESTLEVLSKTLSGEDLATAAKELKSEVATTVSASKRAAADAKRAADLAEGMKGAATGIRDDAVKVVRSAVATAVKRTEARYSAQEEARTARAEAIIAAAEKVDQRTAWVGLGHGLAAIATVGITLAGFWSTLAVVLSLWHWAAASAEEGLGFFATAGRYGGALFATAAVIAGVVVTLRWIVPRVQVAVDAYDQRTGVKVAVRTWWGRLRDWRPTRKR